MLELSTLKLELLTPISTVDIIKGISILTMAHAERNELIHEYFKLGLKYNEITKCMDILHGCCLSIRTSKRINRSLGLHSRRHKSDILEIAYFLLEQCEIHGQTHGYRWMHLKC